MSERQKPREKESVLGKSKLLQPIAWYLTSTVIFVDYVL